MAKSRTVDVIYGPQGPDSQTDTRYGWSSLELDAVGSVRDVSSATGTTTAAASYTDFGDTQPQPGTHPAASLFGGPITHTGATINHYLTCTSGTGPSSGASGPTGQPLQPAAVVTPLGYTSQPQDPAFNLDLYPDRTLNTTTNTWQQPDPHTGTLSNPQRLNHYTYVTNNPHTLIDPTGADPAPSAACQASITCTNAAYGCFSDTSNNCWGPGGENLGTGPSPTSGTSTTTPTHPTPPPNQQHPRQESEHYSTPGDVGGIVCTSIEACISAENKKMAPSFHRICDPRQCQILPSDVNYIPGDEDLYNSARAWYCEEVALVQGCADPINIQTFGLIFAIFTPGEEGATAAIKLIQFLKGLLTKDAPDESAIVFSYSAKITSQIGTRGWTKGSILETVKNPTATHAVWDYTTGAKLPATAYVQQGGGYVVVNDSTNEIVQISDLNNLNWKPVWDDPRFQR